MNHHETNQENRHSIEISFSPNNYVESPVTITNRNISISRNDKYPLLDDFK